MRKCLHSDQERLDQARDEPVADTYPSATSAVGRRHFAPAECERPKVGEASREHHHPVDVRNSMPTGISRALKVAAPLVHCVDGLSPRSSLALKGCSPPVAGCSNAMPTGLSRALKVGAPRRLC